MINTCRLNRNIPEKRNFLEQNSECNLFTVVSLCTMHRKIWQLTTTLYLLTLFAMVKDVYMRILFVPILGIGIPYVSGIIDYSLYSTLELLAAHSFFILTSFVIWTGSSWVHAKLRPLFVAVSNPFTKITAVVTATTLYGVCIGGLSVLTWYKSSREIFSWNNVSKFESICALAVIVFFFFF